MVDVFEVTRNHPVQEQELFVIGTKLSDMRLYFQQHGQFVSGNRFSGLTKRFGHKGEHVRGIGFIKGKVYFLIKHQSHKHAQHPEAEIFLP